MLQDLEIYITAQKMVGFQFVLIGLGLLLIAILAFFIGSSELIKGMKYSALICGIIAISGGLAYQNTESKLLKEKTIAYQEDSKQFHRAEFQRMAKVVKDYPIYQFAFAAFVFVPLLLVLFTKSQFLHGISFTIMIMFVGVLIAEAFSHPSIIRYFEVLKAGLS